MRDLLHWLALPGNNNWLLVLDNVDRNWKTKDPQAYDYYDFLPPAADQGNVLVTTRLAMLKLPDASLRLDDLGAKAAAELLQSYAGRRIEGET